MATNRAPSGLEILATLPYNILILRTLHDTNIACCQLVWLTDEELASTPDYLDHVLCYAAIVIEEVYFEWLEHGFLFSYGALNYDVRGLAHCLRNITLMITAVRNELSMIRIRRVLARINSFTAPEQLFTTPPSHQNIDIDPEFARRIADVRGQITDLIEAISSTFM